MFPSCYSRGQFPPQGFGGGDKFEARLLIPSKMGGAVIGKKGCNIQQLRSDYSAMIRVPDAPGPERIMSVTCEDLEGCCCVIDAAIPYMYEQEEDDGSPKEIRVLVNQGIVGGIIGKGGAKIKEIRESSGANIKAYQSCAPQVSAGCGCGFRVSNGLYLMLFNVVDKLVVTQLLPSEHRPGDRSAGAEGEPGARPQDVPRGQPHLATTLPAPPHSSRPISTHPTASRWCRITWTVCSAASSTIPQTSTLSTETSTAGGAREAAEGVARATGGAAARAARPRATRVARASEEVKVERASVGPCSVVVEEVATVEVLAATAAAAGEGASVAASSEVRREEEGVSGAPRGTAGGSGARRWARGSHPPRGRLAPGTRVRGRPSK